jgi:hypothetical protein
VLNAEDVHGMMLDRMEKHLSVENRGVSQFKLDLLLKAAHFGVSSQAIRHRLSEIYLKLDVKTRLEMMILLTSGGERV